MRREDSRSPRKAPGLDSLLHRLVSLSVNQVGPFSPDLGHCLDEVGASVEETDPVVRGVPVGQHAIGDESLEQGTALGLRVVVDSIGVGQEAEAVGHWAQVWPEGVGRAPDVPAH